MEPTSSRKKRSRTSDPHDSDTDKRRGRPRVEKQDESAADRRRTQIRMAQRAYRQRKESTLDELRKRVSELTNTIELMNKSFVECRDRLYGTDISHDQMIDLNLISTQFEAFVQEARNPTDEVVAPSSRAADRPSSSNTVVPEHQAEVVETIPQAQNVPSWLDQAVLHNSTKSKATAGLEIGLGYTLQFTEMDEDPTQIEFLPSDMQSQNLIPFDKNHGVEHTDVFDTFRVEVPEESLRLTTQMKPPITYSFQETTFARRVFRAATEAAYQLLLDPRRKPSEYERIFRLSLMGRDRLKMIAALRTCLDKGPHEELDLWQAPLIHVGGAGTHYQRRDPFGNLIPKKKTHNLGIIGPQTLALLEDAARNNISTDMTVEVAGFEGEWFDPYDVQGYLEEKGIFVDPSASFTEAEIVEWSPAPSSMSSGSSSIHPHTPPEALTTQHRSTPFTAGQLASWNNTNADLSQWNDFTNMELGAVGFSDAQMGSWMNFLQPGESIRGFNTNAPLGNQTASWDQATVDPLQQHVDSVPFTQTHSPQPRRKSVIIDVSKFVEVLTVSGVCLGRSPGFRRRDVDRALAISSFDAF